ncbi:MAG TPA: methylated-DNA--[protein]-cysteine S-methyltransferase [Oligoflexia bacterium]|nr:methylated-DNA--[protein]-cysteine S-methyltransferase [Oligoflexia bacterium]HMP48622.1 methylated-DNA--[protein]-cysteine S-methyltransferase [Oligoflexia bacterium]
MPNDSAKYNINTPAGIFRIIFSEKNASRVKSSGNELSITSSRFLKENELNNNFSTLDELIDRKHEPYIAWVKGYFNGGFKDSKELVFSYSATASDFQKEVWSAISLIPYGTVVSYQEIALRIGRPSSSRAVANACGSNPFQLFIPCHRVVRQDGSLGGYEAGERIKKFLLNKERSMLPDDQRGQRFSIKVKEEKIGFSDSMG